MFESFEAKSLINIYLSYARKYGVSPAKNELQQETDVYCEKHALDAALKGLIYSLVSDVCALQFDAKYAEDKFSAFATKNKVIRAIQDSAEIMLNHREDDIPDYEYDKILQSLQNATQIKARRETGVWLKQVADDPVSFIAQSSRYDPANIIKTGYRFIDTKHTAGGLLLGELTIVSAPPGRGKSTLLINFGVQAILQGIDVAHIFIGDNENSDGVLRYCSRITSTPQAEIRLNSKRYFDTWAKLKERRKLGDIFIYSYPIGSCTVADIRALLTQAMVENKEWHPKMLIVDYIDNCRRSADRSSYDELGDMYADLKAIGEEMRMTVITASQPKVGTWNDDEAAGMESLAESSKKAHHCDNLFTLNKTSEGNFRLKVAKMRRGQSDFIIDIQVDYATQYVREVGLPGVASQASGVVQAGAVEIPATIYPT